MFLGQLDGVPPEATLLLRTAHLRAQSAHAGQARETGEPFIAHPEAVAIIIWNECGVHDPLLAAAALLHDTVEESSEFGDTGDQPYSASQEMTRANLRRDFPEAVADLVMELSKPKVERQEILDKEHSEREFLKKFIEMTNDAKLLKLADRLHNFRTMGKKSNAKKRENIDETKFNFLPSFISVEAERPEAYALMCEKIQVEIERLERELAQPVPVVIYAAAG